MKATLLKFKTKFKSDEPLGNYIILLILCLFVILQFFLQNSFSIMENELARNFNIDAGWMSLLSSAFFYSYIALQIPSGFLLDRYGIKKVCFFSLVIMGCSCFSFALSSNLTLAFCSRLLMGFGAASGFIAMLKSMHIYFEHRKFILLLSLSEFVGMLGLTLCALLFSYITDILSWRATFYFCGAASFILAYALCWIFNKPKGIQSFIVNEEEKKPRTKGPARKLVFQNVFLNRLVWANGLYAFFLYSIITVFCALWGVPYTEKVYNISTTKAASILNFIYLGLGCASLFLSWFVDKVGLAKITRVSPLFSLLLLVLYIYFPPSSIIVSCVLMFFVGLGCSSYQLAFGIVSQSVSSSYQSSASGFTNMILMSSALILQPLVGIVLSYSQGGILDGSEIYSLAQYRKALFLLPLSLFFSFLFSFFILPKKTPEHISPEKYNH